MGVVYLIHYCFQLLLSLVSSYRYDGDEVNLRIAKSEAKILHEKIKGKHYSDDEVIRIVATRSKAQVNATLNEYKNEYGNDIIKVRKLNVFKNDNFLRNLLLRICICS